MRFLPVKILLSSMLSITPAFACDPEWAFMCEQPLPKKAPAARQVQPTTAKTTAASDPGLFPMIDDLLPPARKTAQQPQPSEARQPEPSRLPASEPAPEPIPQTAQ